MQLSNFDIIIRLGLITLFSGIIGYERERNNAHAGLKTHMLVGISACIIALIQSSIMMQVIMIEVENPGLGNIVRSDPARLIAQVVSGIGFLGGGTIIVTKRNVSGLTTAASIWSIAGVGLAIGMGYLQVAVIGFVFLITILLFIKYVQYKSYYEKMNVEYIGGPETITEITEYLYSLGLKVTHISFQTRIYGNERIYTSTLEISGKKAVEFETMVTKLSHNKNIISIYATNLD